MLEETKVGAMRILITWGSRRGGTEGIARILGEALQREGHHVDVLPPEKAARVTGFDAVVVGGALYANRWHRAARRFVTRRERDLRGVYRVVFLQRPTRRFR